MVGVFEGESENIATFANYVNWAVSCCRHFCNFVVRGMAYRKKRTLVKRIWKIIIVVAVIAGVALWVKSRWRAWFSNVPEEEYVVSWSPDRITLTPGEDFMTQRTVSWRCGDELKESHLELAHNGDTVKVSANGEVVANRVGKDAFYATRLSDLTAGEQYSYCVVTGDSKSRWYSFTMPSNGLEHRRFLYFGDVQDTINGESHKWFAKLYSKFADVDFWACGGDLIEAPVDRYWNYLYASTDSILAMMPIFNATGNHDYIKSLYLTADPRWTRTFVYPQNGAKTAMGKSYYVDMPQMRFIVLDTNGIQDIISVMGEYSWLRSVLSDADGKWKVVMFHHPIYSVRKSRNNVVIRNAFRPLLEKYGVHLVLQGHEHGYMRTVAQTGVAAGNHPVYLISFMSPKAYTSRKEMEGSKIIPDTRMYQVIDYTDRQMTMTAYELETDSVLDEVKITR